METYTLETKTKSEAAALKAFASALKIPFHKNGERPYSTEFTENMDKAEADIKAGRYSKIKPSEIWKL